ncbi:hypothetical protein [Cohnella sp. AR92]|uniref:hypothetical protein n=1 Tax=Cohnella sp. AR92 TaxID=648716 RepID=UPI000F8D40FC|nr:hypothetical protein [Cohnella sp. AR92]RUS43559.1 hypothetical protein ELR57_24845 [Cohnella sp. AR92]
MNIIYITGEKFNSIGFGEAKIDCSPSRHVDGTLTVQVSNIDFSASLAQDIVSSYEDDVIITNATLTFEEVSRIKVKVALYEEDGRSFLVQQSGEILRLKKEWIFPYENEGYTYNFGGVLDWPYGHCSIVITAHGNVLIQFNQEDCINLREFNLRK